MKKVGIFYSYNTKATSAAAEKIAGELGKDHCTLINVEEAKDSDFGTYENLVFGASTWFEGELPNYWDELVPALEGMDFKGKKVAIFGHGNQEGWPYHFGDAVGILAALVSERGGEVVGYTSTDGYSFEGSKAIDGDTFCGLLLDDDTQKEKTDKRIKDWVKELKKAFGG